MSEPRCKTCKHFDIHPIQKDGWGECKDESKLIYSCYGTMSEVDYPMTHEDKTCNNHERIK